MVSLFRRRDGWVVVRLDGVQLSIHQDWTDAWNAAVRAAMIHGADLKVPHSIVTQLMKCTLTQRKES